MTHGAAGTGRGRADERWPEADDRLRFGLFLSQANKDWPQVRDEFRLADDLGFDHAWLVDHLLDTDGPPEHPCLEAWSLLGALALATSRIRIGVLVTSVTFRHPAMLLKQAATVDRVSSGRLVLGLGTGWHADEHRRFGIPLPEVGERVTRLEETAALARLLPTQPLTSFHGRAVELDQAPFQPGPVGDRFSLLVAAHRPRTLRIAARYADTWDTFPTLEGTATAGVEDPIPARVAAVEQACREVGRDPRTLRRSTWAGGSVAGSEERYRAWFERHRALGFTDFITGLPGPDARSGFERLAASVIPALREG